MNKYAFGILFFIVLLLTKNTCFSSENHGLFGDFANIPGEVGSDQYNEMLCRRLSEYGDRGKIIEKVLSKYPFKKDAVYVTYTRSDCFLSWSWPDEKFSWNYKVSLYFSESGKLEKCYSSCKKTVQEVSTLPDGVYAP